MCFVIWLHCFGAEGGQKAVGMCWEKSCLQDHESICNVCFNAFQTVMGQNYSSNRIYIWTMVQFYCKDPEFVQIICFEIALRGSCWPLASDLHWSYELMPKRYCSKTADCCSWHFFFLVSMKPPDLSHKLHLEEALSQQNGKIATVVISWKLTYYFCRSNSFLNCALSADLFVWLTNIYYLLTISIRNHEKRLG